MKITQEQLFKGKATEMKGDKLYRPTEAYTAPFFEKMSSFTNDFIIKVETPNQITVDEDRKDITYNRVWIQAVLPNELQVANHKEVVGLIYGIDMAKPVYKIYKGALDMACTNLSVFNPEYIKVFPFDCEKPINYDVIQTIMEMTNDTVAKINTLKSTTLDRDRDALERELGRWNYNIMKASVNKGFGKIKLPESMANKAFKKLFIDEESKYFIRQDEVIDMYKIYSSFTDLITNDKDGDILNKVEKTLLLQEILEI